MNIQYDEEDKIESDRILAMNVGKYLDGESAKSEFEEMITQKKERLEIEKGNIVLAGEERVERAKQGESVPIPKPINLNRSRGDNRTQFEKDNNLPASGPKPVGDVIE